MNTIWAHMGPHWPILEKDDHLNHPSITSGLNKSKDWGQGGKLGIVSQGWKDLKNIILHRFVSDFDSNKLNQN